MTTATKDYHENQNVGRARYLVNYHDGVKTHADGSRFYDLKIFSNRREKDAFVRELRLDGYQRANAKDECRLTPE